MTRASRTARTAALGVILLTAAAIGAAVPAASAQAQTVENCDSALIGGGKFQFDGCGTWSNQGAPFVFHASRVITVGPGSMCGNNPAGACVPMTTTMYNGTLVCSTISVSANGHRESLHCRITDPGTTT